MVGCPFLFEESRVNPRNWVYNGPTMASKWEINGAGKVFAGAMALWFANELRQAHIQQQAAAQRPQRRVVEQRRAQQHSQHPARRQHPAPPKAEGSGWGGFFAAVACFLLMSWLAFGTLFAALMGGG